MSIFDLFFSSKFNKKRSSRRRPPADPYAEYDEKGNYISPGRRARRIERAHREAMSDQDARNKFYGVRSTPEAFAHDQRQGPIPSNSEMQQSHGQPLSTRRQPTRGGDREGFEEAIDGLRRTTRFTRAAFQDAVRRPKQCSTRFAWPLRSISNASRHAF
jgi:hypothetical protein